jgi:hypothetical protein
MRDSNTEPSVCSPTCRWFAYRTTCSEVEAQPIAARLAYSVHGGAASAWQVHAWPPRELATTPVHAPVILPKRAADHHVDDHRCPSCSRNMRNIEDAAHVPSPWNKYSRTVLRIHATSRVDREAGAQVFLRDTRWQQKPSKFCGIRSTDAVGEGT